MAVASVKKGKSAVVDNIPAELVQAGEGWSGAAMVNFQCRGVLQFELQ